MVSLREDERRRQLGADDEKDEDDGGVVTAVVQACRLDEEDEGAVKVVVGSSCWSQAARLSSDHDRRRCPANTTNTREHGGTHKRERASIHCGTSQLVRSLIDAYLHNADAYNSAWRPSSPRHDADRARLRCSAARTACGNQDHGADWPTEPGASRTGHTSARARHTSLANASTENRELQRCATV